MEGVLRADFNDTVLYWDGDYIGRGVSGIVNLTTSIISSKSFTTGKDALFLTLALN